MKVELDNKKTVEENAAKYFEKAKKAKSKLEGAEEAVAKFKKKEKAELESAQAKQESLQLQHQEKEWYEKYHWSLSSEGGIIVGGTNASSNETLIKHHTDSQDLVFHTELPGAPFVILKGEKSQPAIQEAATLAACYSKAWRAGHGDAEVYYVNPDQVSKQAEAGEYLQKGAFMVRGDRKTMRIPLKLWIGAIQEEGFKPKVMAGSESNVKKHCSKQAIVTPGDLKTSDAAKKLQQKLGGELDDYIKALPAGGCAISNE